MKVSFKWLSELVDLTGISPEEVAHALTNAGLEVEGIEKIEPAFKNVITAKIVEIKPHPNASKLSLCKVYTGSETVNVVCGAKNIKEGDVCPLVLPGGEVSGIKIDKRNIRGETSYGMLCSEKELGLGEDESGILILPEGIEIGTNLKNLVGSDFVFDISITPNRGDCLSLLGISRELSAIFKRERQEPEILKDSLPPSPFEVEIADTEGCPFYCGAVVEGINVRQSPLEMKLKLLRTGIRAINNIVDITNYVLIEIGQPLHAFDMRFLHENIIVRRAKKGEKIETLDEKVRECDEDILLIADRQIPQAIAGVMGGKSSEIREDTKNVFFESAWFNPKRVRISSRKLGLITESSYRFERRVDPEGVEKGLRRALLLMKNLIPESEIKGLSAWGEKPYEKKRVWFPFSFSKSFLGADIEPEEVKSILKRLNFEVEETKDGIFASPPSWRGDVERKEDLAEEVARIKGYENIPSVPLKISGMLPPRKIHLEKIDLIRKYMISNGFTEIISYSFTSSRSLQKFGVIEEPLRIINPLSEEMNVMRPSPIYTLIEVLFHNRKQKIRKGMVFEIGKGFIKREEKVEEPVYLCGGIYGTPCEEVWKLSPLFFIKGIITGVLNIFKKEWTLSEIGEHHLIAEGAGGRIFIKGEEKGWFGMLKNEILKTFDIEEERFYIFELLLEEILKEEEKLPEYTEFGRYPPVLRDISIVVNENTHWEEIKKAVLERGRELIEEIELFDIYRSEKLGKGKKSISFHISLRSKEKTLTDEEIDLKIKHIVSYLKEKTGARLRGEDE